MSHPLLILAMCWLLLLVTREVALRIDDALPQRLTRRAGVISAAAVGILSLFTTIVVWYASRAAFFDPAEPTIAAVAWAFRQGLPLYPALDGPERYAHVYGPMLFVLQAAVMTIAGPGILASKGVGAIAVLASLAVTYVVSSTQAARPTALAATAGCALIYMTFGPVAFWNRPDSLLLLCASLGLLSTVLQRPVAQVLVMGVAMGIAVNLKVTGPLYLAPAAVLMLASRGLGTVSAAGAVGVAIGAAPFLLPNVSIVNYYEYLRLSAENGLLAGRLRQNIEWTIFLCAAPAVLLIAGRSRVRGRNVALMTTLATLAAAMLAAAIATSKPGGGPFHLAPFAPSLAWAVLVARAGWGDRRAQLLVLAFVLATTILAVPRQGTLIRVVQQRDLEMPIADLNGFADSHPGSAIAIGDAGWSYLAHARPAAVFRTGDYLLDAPAVQEHRLSGLEIPASTLEALERCRVEFMLIPRVEGVGPFEMPSAYYPIGPPEVFPPNFRTAFRRDFEPAGSTRFYDVWRCRPAARREAEAAHPTNRF